MDVSQGQTLRCSVCERYVQSKPASSALTLSSSTSNSAIFANMIRPPILPFSGGNSASLTPYIWGDGVTVSSLGGTASGIDSYVSEAVVFPNNHVFHRACFEAVTDSIDNNNANVNTNAQERRYSISEF